MQHSVSHLLHYLDDFITMGRAATTQCQMNCDIIHSICELLGVPLAEDKCECPCTLLEYLGFLLDTTKMTVSLPGEKLNRLIHLIQSWSNRKTCTKHDLDSLIGQLQHASAVVKPGRSFLRRMIVLAKSRHLPSHPIRLNQGFRSDLHEMADSLSRNSISPTMLHTNGLDPHPTVIHREIPNLLLNMQVDWLSQTWIALFNSILSKV